MKIQVEDPLDDLSANLTPMIDVVFLLLVFFMVTTTFLKPEESLEVELPGAASGGERASELEELVVTVLSDGALRLGTEAITRAQLAAVLQRAAANDPNTPVLIRGHRKAAHEAIVAVMDACGLAGLTHLAVGTADVDERG